MGISRESWQILSAFNLSELRARSNAWVRKQNWKIILERLMERIYLMRCQLVHGAATFGGQLNRVSLRHCVTMLGHLLPAVLLVLIDHGADED